MIGILGLQGNVREHAEMFQLLGVKTRVVKHSGDFVGLTGLVIPGGESTTISKLIIANRLTEKLTEVVADKLPIFGTCAGLVLLATKVIDNTNSPEISLGAIDITVQRNAFGRQQESFETLLPMNLNLDISFPAVFIRAPKIEQVGNGVRILASLPKKLRSHATSSAIVAAANQNVLVTAFHPELTHDTRVHEYFLEQIADY